MSRPNLYAVVLAGGSGTRFWPASRADRPKQFLPIAGGRPMIVETVRRLEGLVPTERVLVVTAESQAALVREALPELPAENVLAEPEARNTAPCIGLAAFDVARRDADSVQVVLPADHVIQPAEAFRRTIAAAADEAAAGDVLVTFGIRPDHPATGYGYIEAGPRVGERDGIAVHTVERFVEKPDLATARAFLADGSFLWNSGMFVWRTSAIVRALERHLPEVPAGLARAAAGASLAEVYAGLPRVPIDTAVMERADNVRMLPIDYRWSDVGSWAALPEVHEVDAQGNWAVLAEGAELVTEDASGCVAYAERSDELIALVGVEDLIVVRAGGATLVCRRDRAQDVRAIVEKLKQKGSSFL